MTRKHILINPEISLSMVGPSLEEGPLPAIFYFALSGKDSLETDPFNQPVTCLKSLPIRIFSLNLPFHEEEASPITALENWGKTLIHSDTLITHFIEKIRIAIQTLLTQNILIPGKIGAMGLSRGGFIATHAAAAIAEIGYVIGFSPLTRLSEGKEFEKNPITLSLDLENLIPSLIGKPLKFYIGNHDTRVGTRFCFEFIQALTEASYQKNIRSPLVELTLFPSIGYQGHGTPPLIFHEGAHLLAKKLHG